MAVIQIRETRDGRAGTRSAEQGRTYQRTFQVITNNPHDGPATVLSALGLKYGDRYVTPWETDLRAFLNDYSATADGIDGTVWKVVVNYAWVDWQTTGNGPDNNPLDAPIEVSWGFKSFERVVWTDEKGTPVLNTAGEPFDPPVTIDEPRPVLTIQRNEPLGSGTPALAFTYRSAVNSDPFAGADPLCAKVAQISFKRVFSAEIGFYLSVNYEFEFNPDNFHRKIPSMGLRQLKTGSTTTTEQILINKSPVSNPVPLDAKGRYNPGQLILLEFQVYPELPFAMFNFDPDILIGAK